MKYRNLKTGATFSSSCVVSGGDWVEVTNEVKIPEITKEEVIEVPQEVEEVPQEVAEEVEEATDDEAYNAINIKQIKQELDAFGVEYNPRAKKKELYDLMMKGK
ncbi:hypothetical protein [Vagococcus xieshaowenii]|uniref:HeH/LEM domain-containing protein n=1 Tax=Vagococcus xieshaowenii TaxID=2562451 RepID=A0A4Z0DAK5_9ENTE|nr:hypothetical protein [Vagococcus xieshaowenii]QCA28252.1 hypothetical protein E4Z98_02575 [Vagococcus xieshaowenii]TFZ41906.1 hypothetical protein E4031_04755 [Vagococcus xieshaowenii]